MKEILTVVNIYLGGKKVGGFNNTTSVLQNAKDFNKLIVFLMHHLAAQLAIAFGKYEENIRAEHIEVKVTSGAHSRTVLDIWGVIPMNSTEIDKMLSESKVSEEIQDIVLDYILSHIG